jgi:small subunit ribosomal protein S6
MSLYEHVFIVRQDLSEAQAKTLIDDFSEVLSRGGGRVVYNEYWGLRTLAYRVKKNRKGHYAMLHIDAVPEAVAEMERLMGINSDVIRFVTLKVKKHQEGQSIMLKTKNSPEGRGKGGFGGGGRPRY